MFLVWDDGLVSWFPVGRAHLSVLVGILESLNESEGLVHISSNWGIVDLDCSNDTLLVDDEETSKGGTVEVVVFVFNEDPVVPGDVLADVGE